MIPIYQKTGGNPAQTTQKEGFFMYRTLYGPQGGHINLDGRDVINMASNNYLGLANHPALVAAAKEAIDQFGVGPCASRNIVGNFTVHDELEEKLAKFKDVEATLVFNCGVSANSGVIPCLARSALSAKAIPFTAMSLTTAASSTDAVFPARKSKFSSIWIWIPSKQS